MTEFVRVRDHLLKWETLQGILEALEAFRSAVCPASVLSILFGVSRSKTNLCRTTGISLKNRASGLPRPLLPGSQRAVGSCPTEMLNVDEAVLRVRGRFVQHTTKG